MFLIFKDNQIATFSLFQIFLGSNTVMQVALGRSGADEMGPGLHKISEAIWRV